MGDDNVISILNAKKLRPLMNAVMQIEIAFVPMELHDAIDDESMQKLLSGQYDFVLKDEEAV